MKQVFISYAYRDEQSRASVAFLREHLPAFGAEPVDIFMNEMLAIGDDWRSSLTEAINRCSIFICFASEMNPNVMFELGYALGKNKQIILIGDSKSIPADLQHMAYISKDSHPYDVLAQVQKCLSTHDERIPFLGLDPHSPRHNICTLVDRPDLLDSLEGRELEELIKHWFLMKNYTVDAFDETRDCGFDFMVSPFRGERAAVEVKKYRTTSRVPVSVIRQLLGAMVVGHIPIGIIVSSAPFTESAFFFAKEINPTVLLWTLEDLVRMNEMPRNRLEYIGDQHSGPSDAPP